MKTKLSPLEELRAERLRLKDECTAYELSIKNNVSYVKHNFGSLLLSSVFNSTKSSLSSLFLGSSDPENPNNSSFLSKISTVAPVVLGLVQPFIISYATKKIKSMIFGKKRK